MGMQRSFSVRNMILFLVLLLGVTSNAEAATRTVTLPVQSMTQFLAPETNAIVSVHRDIEVSTGRVVEMVSANDSKGPIEAKAKQLQAEIDAFYKQFEQDSKDAAKMEDPEFQKSVQGKILEFSRKVGDLRQEFLASEFIQFRVWTIGKQSSPEIVRTTGKYETPPMTKWTVSPTHILWTENVEQPGATTMVKHRLMSYDFASRTTTEVYREPTWHKRGDYLVSYERLFEIRGEYQTAGVIVVDTATGKSKELLFRWVAGTKKWERLTPSFPKPSSGYVVSAATVPGAQMSNRSPRKVYYPVLGSSYAVTVAVHSQKKMSELLWYNVQTKKTGKVAVPFLLAHRSGTPGQLDGWNPDPSLSNSLFAPLSDIKVYGDRVLILRNTLATSTTSARTLDIKKSKNELWVYQFSTGKIHKALTLEGFFDHIERIEGDRVILSNDHNQFPQAVTVVTLGASSRQEFILTESQRILAERNGDMSVNGRVQQYLGYSNNWFLFQRNERGAMRGRTLDILGSTNVYGVQAK